MMRYLAMPGISDSGTAKIESSESVSLRLLLP
jgi:hypothetical protein